MNGIASYLLRSLLFVPALSAKHVASAPRCGADAFVVDLEDSIAPAMKAEARSRVGAVVDGLAQSGTPVFVRVNNEAAHLEADLRALSRSCVAGIFLPKVERCEDVSAAARLLDEWAAAGDRSEGAPALVLLIESPSALQCAAALASADERVAALVFGGEDYSAAMQVRPTLEAMRFPAQVMGLAARASGRAAWGIAGSIAEFSDLASFRAMAEVARDAGYGGACAIHPRQVPVLNEVFGVSDDEAREAAAIVAAYEHALANGTGVVAHEGRMLDLPVVERARKVLRKARRQRRSFT